MPRPLVYLCAWAMTASVIVGVSWFGINRALGAAVSSQTKPLSAADLREALPSATPSESPSPTPSPSPSSPSPSPSSPPPSAAAPSSSKPSSPTPGETWATEPDGKGGLGYKRTFRTVGGDVVVWSARGDARILDVFPKAGWGYAVRQDADDSALVTLTLSGQRGRTAYVSVGWLNGGPIAEFGETVGP